MRLDYSEHSIIVSDYSPSLCKSSMRQVLHPFLQMRKWECIKLSLQQVDRLHFKVKSIWPKALTNRILLPSMAGTHTTIIRIHYLTSNVLLIPFGESHPSSWKQFLCYPLSHDFPRSALCWSHHMLFLDTSWPWVKDSSTNFQKKIIYNSLNLYLVTQVLIKDIFFSFLPALWNGHHYFLLCILLIYYSSHLCRSLEAHGFCSWL